jgi:hypothetical protein
MRSLRVEVPLPQTTKWIRLRKLHSAKVEEITVQLTFSIPWVIIFPSHRLQMPQEEYRGRTLCRLFERRLECAVTLGL